MSNKSSLAIITCTLGKVRIERAVCAQTQEYGMGRNHALLTVLGAGVDDARNVGIQMAREKGCDFALFWDDDVIIHSSLSIQQMVATMEQHSEIDILGGVYPRRGTNEPIVVKDIGEGVWWGWRDEKVTPVYMTGTGFLLIRMSSLTKLNVRQYTFKKTLVVHRFFNTTKKLSDDFYFAKLCAKYGLNWYVAGSALADQIELDGKLWKIDDGVMEIAVEDEKPTNVSELKVVA